MTRIIKAELLRLVHRRTAADRGSRGPALLRGGGAVGVLLRRGDGPGIASRRGGGTRSAALAGHGGGTEAFAVGASFVGFFVFVTFIALLAGEFSGGTFRALLLREPHRLRVIVGKLAGILLVAAAAVAFAEAATFVLSLLIAPTQDVATTDWFSLHSLADAGRDYATVFAGVAGWAIFGTTLAVIFRSTPIALARGLRLGRPVREHHRRLVVAGYRVFPGQVLASLIRGGTVELGLGRALLTAALYAAVAATVTLVLVSRRDVTA